MFTDAQKARIRQVLGYPAYFRYKHTRLESVLDRLDPDSEDLVITAIGQLDVLEPQLLEAAGAGGVIRVDEIWFEKTGKVRIANLRSTARMYVSRISIVLGVPLYSDYYGGGGYLGDNFSGPPAGNRGGGGFYGLG